MDPIIFQSLFATAFLRPLSRLIVKITGWSIEGADPRVGRAVVIGAYHTSNWDFVLAMLFAFSTGFPMHWMGKASLFNWPFNPLFKWLGGIPIDRSRSNNLVEASVRELSQGDIRFLVVAPEGTRKKSARWKTGFYHIAKGARVPIVLGFVDYKRKEIGLGPVITVTGDMEADFALIREFYDGVTARYPEKANLL